MKNKWLHFDIDKENIFGLVCGLFMVLLSMAMALFTSEISSIILRDILMILFLGFLTPIYYICFIFEMVFIYGFLRYEFERAFGVLPAIFITAIFYSLHHAGFQPEFTKLFFVGVMYVTVFYFTHNIFSIFPFFWGVGAIWDVLVNSEAGNQIKNETSFAVAMLMLIAMIGIGFFIYCKIKK